MIKQFLPLILLAACGLAVVRAQPSPKLDSVSPDWVQRDTAVELVFSGENLTNAGGLIFGGGRESAPGDVTVSAFKAIDDKTVSAKIRVASGALPGPREVRLAGPTGVSESITINVGDLPEVRGRETNNTPETAQWVALPAAINGRIREAAEVDYFRFHAQKGEQLIFDVYASRMGSPLDSTLAVLDAQGRELAHNEDANGFDSLIEFAVPEEGDYLVQLRDARYRGGGDFKYRLYAGAIPHLDSIFPLGGRRGQSVEIALAGRNLGDLARLTNQIDPSAPLDITEIRTHEAGYFSNSKKFQIGDLPELFETEPNNTLEQANMVEVPVTINGHINPVKDVDVFRFKSDRDQHLLCEVTAQRFGSPLDALLTLMDAKGNVLARNDDSAGMDARVDYDKFGKDQEYALSIRDLNDRGGDDFAYRLSIHPPRPGFVVKFLPDIPRVNRGGHTVVRCEITRSGGFSGAVRASLEGLPPGVYSEPLVFTSEHPITGLMVVSAARDASLGHFPIHLSAAAVVNDSMTAHSAELNRSRHSDDEGFLTVLDTPPFVVDVLSLLAEADQGQAATVEVEVQRAPGFTNEIQLTAEGYSLNREPITNNIEISAAGLSFGQTATNLILNIKSGAETGTRTIVVKATATNNDSLITEYTQTLPLTVRPIPFTLAGSLPRLSVAALPPGVKSAAGEAVFLVKADRRAGFDGDIPLTLEGLPEGIVATFEKIPAGQSEIPVKLTATDKAPLDKEISFTFRGTGTLNDRNYKYSTKPIKLTVTKPEAETAGNETAGNPPLAKP